MVFNLWKKTFWQKSLLAMSCVGMFAACSDEAVGSAQVKKAFQEKFPQREVVEVRKTPVAGVFEVALAGRQVVYTDASARFLFVGELIDAEAGESLTDQRVAELSRVDWKKLPLNQAIIEVRGQGRRKIAVFSDPDCPFCQRLERQSLAGLDDVTIYTFLYPLEQLHPQAMLRSAQVWCAEDRLKAWKSVILEGKNPPPLRKDCQTPLEDIQKLGRELGIHGTPALIFENGQIVSGAIPKAQIETHLKQKK